MRIIYILLFYFLIVCVTTTSYSQEYESAKERNKHKPLLFEKYADSTDTHPYLFNAVSAVKLNDKVTVQVMQQMVFKGTVTTLQQTDDYKTVSIQSEEIPSLRLIISHTSEDKYYGMIGCIHHKDVLILRQDETTKKYSWIKKEMADIIPD